MDREPVHIVGWEVRHPEHAAEALHFRRMASLRDDLCARLKQADIPFRLHLLSREYGDRSAAVPFLEGFTGQRQAIVVCCEWEIPKEAELLLTELHRRGDLRVLLLTTAGPHLALPTICFNHSTAGRELAQHCLASGYRRLLYIAPYQAGWSQARSDAVRQVAATARLSFHSEPPAHAADMMVHLEQSEAVQRSRLRIALGRGLTAIGRDDERHCAIIACNDEIALAIRANLPQFTGGLAGFDDSPAAHISELTSMRPPLGGLGARAAEYAIRLWNNGAIPELTELPWELIARISTRSDHASARHVQPTTTVQRIDNSTQVGVQITLPVEPCPPVVIICWGRLSHTDPGTYRHAQRLLTARRGLLAVLRHARIESAVLEIDLDQDGAGIERRMQRATRRVLSGGAKIVIIQELALHAEAEDALSAAEKAGNLRLVRMNTIPTSCDSVLVSHDQSAGGSMAANHCLKNGYRRILYLSPIAAAWAQERRLSAQQAVALASGELSEVLHSPESGAVNERAWVQLDMAERHKLIHGALETGLNALNHTTEDRSPPAIICCNDEVALQVHQIILARGLRPGIDIGLIGFDDSPEAVNIELTSLAPPMPAMGGETARICLRLLAGDEAPRRTLIPWTLMERASTARA